MNLNKVKKDIGKMKEEIGISNKPTLRNFFKFCEKYYGRPVDCGEVWFKYYYRNGQKYESNKLLFFRLSEEYFTNIHNVPNPIKEGRHSIKWLYAIHWAEEIKKDANIHLDKVVDNSEFNEWFEGIWAAYKKEFDKIDLDNFNLEK